VVNSNHTDNLADDIVIMTKEFFLQLFLAIDLDYEVSIIKIL
jgi:hypothetical protein